jgi:hypothetical protein
MDDLEPLAIVDGRPTCPTCRAAMELADQLTLDPEDGWVCENPECPSAGVAMERAVIDFYWYHKSD